MTITGIIVLLLVAGVCGGIGSSIGGYSHTGCLGSVALGFLGAWLGSWFARQVHLPEIYVLVVHGESFPVVWSILGAAVFAGVMSALTSRNPYGF